MTVVLVLMLIFQSSSSPRIDKATQAQVVKSQTKRDNAPPRVNSEPQTDVDTRRAEALALPTKTAMNPWDKAFAPETWSNWALVFVGITASLIAFWTLATIQQQTTALMNADRPLLLIMWENFVHLNPKAPGGILSHCFNWRFKNTGKSPAFIQAVSCRFVPVEKMGDLSKNPRYIVVDDVRDEMEPLLPGEISEQLSAVIESGYSFEELESKHRGRECSLYAYGFVRYKDFHGRGHETRFGVVYGSRPTPQRAYDRFKLAGPAAYNRYT